MTKNAKVTPRMLSHGHVDQAKPLHPKSACVTSKPRGRALDTPVGNTHRDRFPTVYPDNVKAKEGLVTGSLS